ncbi:MAG: hypothetical protein KGI84_00735 [Elusimicrobia bacterium]|nr:hypothetical protein [Elusimicrobiota bacterium]
MESIMRADSASEALSAFFNSAVSFPAAEALALSRGADSAWTGISAGASRAAGNSKPVGAKFPKSCIPLMAFMPTLGSSVPAISSIPAEPGVMPAPSAPSILTSAIPAAKAW